MMATLTFLFGAFTIVAATTPQQISWFYANNLTTGANFFKNTLQLPEVTNLVQKDKCRIFHSTYAPSSYLGVCNTRPAPSCKPNSNGSTVPFTYTFVAPSQEKVEALHSQLVNHTNLIVTVASGSAIWGAYGFNFYDTNVNTGLGCYRFEVQYFTDPQWGLDTYVDLEHQLIAAGEQLQVAPTPTTPIACPCKDFCSGRCFAASCKPCASDVWNGDENSCLNAGPLGQGLLCQSPVATQEPCCQPNGTVCSIVGGHWCDCSAYPKEVPLFPPLATRRYENGTCVQGKPNDGRHHPEHHHHPELHHHPEHHHPEHHHPAHHTLQLSPTLQYFGFWGPGSPSQMNTFTNLAFASTPSEAVQNGKHGIHSLVKLDDIFVNKTVRWHYRLNRDYAARWAEYSLQLKPLIANKSALGFFLGDELLWNGLNFTEMVEYADCVRKTFPNGTAIIYTNAAWPTLFPTTPGEPTSAGDIGAVPQAQLWLHVPTAIDWWGVDLYPDQFSQEGALTVIHANVLRKFTTPTQRLVVIPPFYGSRANSTTNERRQLDCGDADCDYAMVKWAQQFMRTYLNTSYADSSRVVAAMPYRWTSLGNGSGMRQQGGEELPRARDLWMTFGRVVVGAEKRRRNREMLLPGAVSI
jgi:hypothetical protein